jgi:hypothetical protein
MFHVRFCVPATERIRWLGKAYDFYLEGAWFESRQAHRGLYTDETRAKIVPKLGYDRFLNVVSSSSFGFVRR